MTVGPIILVTMLEDVSSELVLCINKVSFRLGLQNVGITEHRIGVGLGWVILV